jgi:hypothetical protein
LDANSLFRLVVSTLQFRGCDLAFVPKKPAATQVSSVSWRKSLAVEIPGG